jgi:hypothetical protein
MLYPLARKPNKIFGNQFTGYTELPNSAHKRLVQDIRQIQKISWYMREKEKSRIPVCRHRVFRSQESPVARRMRTRWKRRVNLSGLHPGKGYVGLP